MAGQFMVFFKPSASDLEAAAASLTRYGLTVKRHRDKLIASRADSPRFRIRLSTEPHVAAEAAEIGEGTPHASAMRRVAGVGVQRSPQRIACPGSSLGAICRVGLLRHRLAADRPQPPAADVERYWSNVMWPFTSRKKPAPVPAIRVGEVLIQWKPQFGWWEFTDGEFDYSFDDPEFDVAVIDLLGMVRRWLVELDREIDAEIQKNLEGWCEWTGEKHVVGIDISGLVGRSEIDVSYAGGYEWGDLGVNVVITDGKVTNSYAGD